MVARSDAAGTRHPVPHAKLDPSAASNERIGILVNQLRSLPAGVTRKEVEQRLTRIGNELNHYRQLVGGHPDENYFAFQRGAVKTILSDLTAKDGILINSKALVNLYKYIDRMGQSAKSVRAYDSVPPLHRAVTSGNIDVTTGTGARAASFGGVLGKRPDFEAVSAKGAGRRLNSAARHLWAGARAVVHHTVHVAGLNVRRAMRDVQKAFRTRGVQVALRHNLIASNRAAARRKTVAPHISHQPGSSVPRGEIDV